MPSAMKASCVLLSTLLLVITGSSNSLQQDNPQNAHHHRAPREVRKGSREGRLYYETSEEANDPRKMLLFRNPPREPPDDMYRKGFSYLHVPDFHRLPVEERAPRRGNQSIDDIISGIIHLLGGDVHVTRPDVKPYDEYNPPSPRPTRINNRGPAHFNVYTQTSASTVTPSESVTETANRWVFPDDTDVSLILGLLNRTESASGMDDSTKNRLESSFTSGGSNVTSTHLELVEIIPSVEPSSHFVLESTGSEIPSEIIRPTEVLTELDKNGMTFIETVVTAQMPSAGVSVISNRTAPSAEQSQSSSRTRINYTELPIILPSTSSVQTTSSTRQTQPVPLGPVTEWLPVGRHPERTRNSTSRLNEPIIITRQPDNFEITVTQQMYTNQSRVKVIPTTTPPDVTSSTDISVSIVTTKVDVIYGRPTISVTPSHVPPTGRPQVYAVDIAEIRPSKRPPIYHRPRPNEGQRYNNGLKPLPVPRPGGGTQRKPPIFRPPPPQMPEIRIDTCVVGDDSTCDVQLHEHCRTERGVSSCLCRPSYGRVLDRGMCTPVVSMLLTLKVAKVGDRNIDPTHFVPGSQEYQRLNFEASHAMATVFTYSPLAEGFRGSHVNRVYFIANRMVINSTIHLSESEVRGSLRHHVEHAVATAISRQNNQLGNSQLFISGPLSALVEVEDLNECGDVNLNDCSEFSVCENLFGTFQCRCKPGYTDKSDEGMRHAGRICSACSPDYCNGKGQCVVVSGRQECRCRGNYGGARCQVDNEVIGVSVGVSVIAIIVIAITAACLYLWNRRWKRAHQKSEAVKHAGYRLQTLADHVRWGPASPLGSTYVPSESTLQLAPPQLSASASQLYAISTVQPPRRQQRNQLYDDDANPYGRIIRTLQKHNNNHTSGLQYDTLNSECASSDDIGCPSVPSNSFIYHGTFTERSIYR